VGDLGDVALTTPRLRLRPVGPQDVPGLYAMFSDPEVVRYWSTPPWTSRAQAERLVEEDAADRETGRALRLAVLHADGGALIGTASLFHLDRSNRRAEIGYALLRSAWGHGYAREAVRALVGEAFTGLDLNRLEADIDPRNDASARLLERLGFVREGLLRERWIVAGDVSDSALYGLLRKDWDGVTP
jgi:RimJ/RimL family protein N-acetyltransferase